MSLLKTKNKFRIKSKGLTETCLAQGAYAPDEFWIPPLGERVKGCRNDIKISAPDEINPEPRLNFSTTRILKVL